MKKALILALSLILCLSVFSFSAIGQDLSDESTGGDTGNSGSTSNSSTSNYAAGDVNDDGVVNISDVQALLKYVNGQDVPVVEATLDMNGDGIINISDVQVLLKYVNEQNIVPDSNTMYQEDFSFAEIDNYTFVYASGVGAWGAYLTVYEDGSFEGYYNDWDGAGVDLEGNMHIEDYGVNYHCEFSGRFSEPIQLDDHVYSSKIERLDYKYEVGTEGYIDGYFYVFTDTCGLKIGDEVLIYTSDVCVGDLPAEIINWCYPFGNEKDYLTPDMLLEKYVIWDELGGGIFLYYM